MAAQGFGLAPHFPEAAQGLQVFVAQGLQPVLEQGFFAAQGFLVAQGFFAAHGLHPALQPAWQYCPALHLPLHGEQGLPAAAASPPVPSMAVIRAADHQVARRCSNEVRIAFLRGCIVDIVSLPDHGVVVRAFGARHRPKGRSGERHMSSGTITLNWKTNRRLIWDQRVSDGDFG